MLDLLLIVATLAYVVYTRWPENHAKHRCPVCGRPGYDDVCSPMCKVVKDSRGFTYTDGEDVTLLNRDVFGF